MQCPGMPRRPFKGAPTHDLSVSLTASTPMNFRLLNEVVGRFRHVRSRRPHSPSVAGNSTLPWHRSRKPRLSLVGPAPWQPSPAWRPPGQPICSVNISQRIYPEGLVATPHSGQRSDPRMSYPQFAQSPRAERWLARYRSHELRARKRGGIANTSISIGSGTNMCWSRW